jgi:hypothetical protein
MKNPLISIALLLIAGSVTARDFVPIQQEGQVIEFDRGQAILYFGDTDFSAMASFEPVSKKRGWVRLGFRNNGQSSFTISERSIKAATSDEEKIEVLT